MRKYIYILASIFTASLLAFAESPNNAEQLCEAANKEFEANHFESSLQLCLKADSAYQAEGMANTADYAMALHLTGRAYFNTNNIKEAREYTKQALILRENLFGKVSREYIVSLNNYALSFLMTNELEEALKYQTEVIELCNKLNPPHPDEGLYLINLGRIYDAMQDDDNALKYMEEALTKVEKFSENYEYALCFLGIAYVDKNDNANAYRIMELMDEHNQHEISKDCVTPEDHLERAKYYMLTDQPANAKDEFMIVFAMDLTDNQMATAYRQYAEFLSSQQDFAQAEEYLAMAAKASKSTNGDNEANSVLEKCQSLSNNNSDDNDASVQHRNDTLREIIQSSVNTLEQGGGYLGKLSNAQTFSIIAGSYALLKEYTMAVDYYTQYINAIRPALAEDFLLKNPKEREFSWKQELSTITEMNALITELPEDASDLYFRLSNLIYEGQLLAKGILLSSNIEFDKVLTRYGTPEMKNQYQQIKNGLIDIDKMRHEHRPLEEIQLKTREIDALQLSLARKSATKGLFTDFIRYTSADVVNALNDDEAAIEFVTLETEISPSENLIVAVVVCKEFPTGITIPICTVGKFNSIIGDEDRFTKDSYTLTVWDNIFQIIQNKKKLYFSPDGVLNNIGIEYLTINGTPINEMVEMSRLSSTREICREHSSQPIQYAALFGNIDYMGDPSPASDKRKYLKTRETDGLVFSTLEDTDREVNEINSLLKKNIKKTKIFKYTGEKASKEEFLSQEKLPINLLHIATHGKYIDNDNNSDNDAMNRSILAFAGANLYDSIAVNEGIVTAAEIADMSLQDCELVVLSACESGLGKLGNDGVFGLQRGFKNAGVKSLLVSLNEVTDESTADMMIAFYRYLLTTNSSKQEALKNAQSEIRAKYPNDNTWAYFILIDSFN